MTTDNAFKAILDNLPPKPARSRLEPYAELIRELHRRGRTYREIALILSERCGLQTSRSTVNDFVRACSKRPRNSQKLENLQQPKPQTPKSGLLPQTKIPIETAAPAVEIQRRIEDLKRRPMPTDAGPQVFHYDPDKPLSLRSKPKKS